MKLRDSISQWMEKQEVHWRALSRERQRKITVLLFAIYLAISVGVYLKYWYDVGFATTEIEFRHIENPVLKSKSATQQKDTILNTYK
ncbi:nitrogen regulatory IIA protein [Flavobacterium sp.]|uniref:nitrogen regulatory IIA protein n=1 Tax=Flavobacterium sp. TaxID=239 RepID=UPI00403315FA